MNGAEALALFDADFKHEVFLWLGGIYFVILLYWLISLKDELLKSFYSASFERVWCIISLLAGILFAGLLASEWEPMSAGTAVAIGLCVSLAMIHVSASACLLASSLYLRPWELLDNDPYLSVLPRLSIILCLSHLVIHFLKKGKISFQWNRLSQVLLAFTVWVFLSTLVAPDSGASQSEFFDGFMKSILLYFILIQMVRQDSSLKLLKGTLLLSFLFVGIISLYQTLKLGAALPDVENRLKGFGAFTNSNDIAALMTFILPFSMVVALRKREAKLMRALGWLLSLVAITAIVWSRSRGALLGVMATLVLYVILRIGKKAIVPVIGLAVLLAIPAMILVSNRGSDDLEGSSAGRKTYLKAGLRMGTRNPILGVGFNAFPESLQTYSTESLEESNQMTAHNSWILVFAETGVPGLILFTLAFAICIRYSWQIYASQPEFLLALVGYGVSIFFLSHSYLIYPYLLYALVHIAHSLRKA